MRFGNWRVVAAAFGCALALGLASGDATADGFHTIPSLTPAVDLNTGQPYYAPPVPYGHYAGKNLTGKFSGKFHGLMGGLGGHGFGGHGLGHGKGGGCDSCGGGGGGCDSCGGGGHALFKKKSFGCGLCGDRGCASCVGTVVPSAQSVVMPAPQGMPCAGDPCGDPGCKLFGKLRHGKSACGSCGGGGCGSCGGLGLGSGCNACGGAGCGLCSKAKGLAHGLISKALGHDKIKWFNGPGGPVPLTPGYVPYVNPVRSPRDFFAFPPMTP